MKGRRLLTCAALALLLLVLVNLLIARAARVSLRRQFLAHLDALPPDVNCLFLGNSLIEAGCDPTAFKAAWPDTNRSPIVVNLGLGATTPVEHYIVLKHALEHTPHLKYLIYGFFDDQLNCPIRGGYSDLVGNRAFSYYFPEEAAGFYAPGSRLESWQMRIIGKIPMLAERSSLWGKVELLRRRLGEIGMPHQAVNRFGRVADFANLEVQDVPSFVQRCETIVHEHEGFSPPVREILRLAHEHGVTVFLVEMPMSAQHRRLFYSLPAWKDLRAYLQSLAAEEHAFYIPASDWIADDRDFEDAVHLNERGAALFSNTLAPSLQLIAQQSETPQALRATQTSTSGANKPSVQTGQGPF